MNTCFSPRSLLSLLLGLSLAAATALHAEDAASGDTVLLTQPQLERLLGPVALYPDALIALILPASTVPTDVVLAARYLNNGGDPAQVDNQPWNDSIKALARYPVLVKWMDENLQWTSELGSAFLNQPADVMNSVQRLRAQARATGALTSNPQQQIVMDDDIIQIVPTEPDVIYVPYYDPEIVYFRQPGYYSGPYLTFGFGFPIGFWLSYDLDWRTRVILVGDRHHNWREHRDWDRRGGPGVRSSNGNWRTWQAPAIRPPFARPANRPPRGEVFQPRPLPGAPAGTRDSRPRDRDRPRLENDSRDQSRNPAPNPALTSPTNRDNRDRRAVPSPSTPSPETTAAPASPPQAPAQANTPASGNRERRGDRQPSATPQPPGPGTGPVPVAPQRPTPGPVSTQGTSSDRHDRRTPTGPAPENNRGTLLQAMPSPVPSSTPPPMPARPQSVGPTPALPQQSAPAPRSENFREQNRPPPSRPEPRLVNPPPAPRPANPPAPPPPNPKERVPDKDNQ